VTTLSIASVESTFVHTINAIPIVTFTTLFEWRIKTLLINTVHAEVLSTGPTLARDILKTFSTNNTMMPTRMDEKSCVWVVKGEWIFWKRWINYFFLMKAVWTVKAIEISRQSR